MAAAVRGGADYDVRYVAFSLDQVHVPEDEPPVWVRPPGDRGSGVLALCYGIAARDRFPDRFVDAHLELFRARHERGGKIAEEAVLRDAVTRAGLDADAVAEWAHHPDTLATLAREHTEMVEQYGVFGVPTFVAGNEAVFVRFMEKERVDDLERMLELVEWTRLNEFKRSRIPR